MSVLLLTIANMQMICTLSVSFWNFPKLESLKDFLHYVVISYSIVL